MEEIQTRPGTYGVPSARWHYGITRHQAGEPEPKALDLPRGYTILRRPVRDRAGTRETTVHLATPLLLLF
ncbi:MAG: hypothetical protein JNK87_29410 [Bryobacterales bacterium]|nr:hypothetical protein [Bryobacterales bacterium]